MNKTIPWSKVLFLTFVLILSTLIVQAKIVVKMDEARRTGSKSLIKLKMKNAFKEKIESARAQIFLLDDEGKMVGQAAQWVIGGTKDKPPLAPDASTTFNFAIPTDKPFSKTKITFTRIILEGGKLVDAAKNVEIAK